MVSCGGVADWCFETQHAQHGLRLSRCALQEHEESLRTFPCTYRTLTSCICWMVRAMAGPVVGSFCSIVL